MALIEIKRLKGIIENNTRISILLNLCMLVCLGSGPNKTSICANIFKPFTSFFNTLHYEYSEKVPLIFILTFKIKSNSVILKQLTI